MASKELSERQEKQRSRAMLLNMHKKCDSLYECNTDNIKLAIEKEIVSLDRSLGNEPTFEPWWEE